MTTWHEEEALSTSTPQRFALARQPCSTPPYDTRPISIMRSDGHIDVHGNRASTTCHTRHAIDCSAWAVVASGATAATAALPAPINVPPPRLTQRSASAHSFYSLSCMPCSYASSPHTAVPLRQMSSGYLEPPEDDCLIRSASGEQATSFGSTALTSCHMGVDYPSGGGGGGAIGGCGADGCRPPPGDVQLPENPQSSSATIVAVNDPAFEHDNRLLLPPSQLPQLQHDSACWNQQQQYYYQHQDSRHSHDARGWQLRNGDTPAAPSATIAATTSNEAVSSPVKRVRPYGKLHLGRWVTGCPIVQCFFMFRASLT